jgi:hypothetical protein
VKADIRAVAGKHIVMAKSRHRLRSGHGFRHRRFGGHRRFGRHRGGFRHGRRHGNTKFLLGLAFPFAFFAYGPDVRYNYYGGHNHGHGVIGGHGHGGSGSYGLGPGRAGYSAGCRAVIRFGFDRFGRRAKIGGTMCFDRYGNSYIPSHSRHVIHYCRRAGFPNGPGWLPRGLPVESCSAC